MTPSPILRAPQRPHALGIPDFDGWWVSARDGAGVVVSFRREADAIAFAATLADRGT